MQTPLLLLKFSTCDIPQKVAAIFHPIGQIATVSSCMDEKFPEDIAPYMYKLVLTKPHGLSQTYYRCFASDTFPDMRQMFCFVERSGGGGWQ